jgi:phosphoglycolate phosphatase
MPLKAVLFDLDGTLIDSIPFHKKSFQLLFAKFGQELPEREIRKYIRWSTEEIYRKLHVWKRLGLDIEKFLELRRVVYYSLIRGKKMVFPNRVRLLKRLRKRYKLALVTNSSVYTTRRSTPESLLRLFDRIVTFSDVLRGKPSPDMLVLACRKLRLKPSDCVVVGDSVVDMKAAHAARVPAVAFYSKTGASTLSELRKEKPVRVVRSVSELERFLENQAG